MEDIIECEYCGGEAYHMGTLGNMAHYRCRHCGMDSSIETGDFDFGMHEASDDFFSAGEDDTWGGDSIED